ncbi:NYN domain-containing protein [Sinorhizobium sp. 8-89]|uniref:LabA-like NYN domain-containing protein n=1 Tax=Sinorhizobium sp. 7-81 TaxID=3049087 RepID=UPI0024C2EA3A|nr:NYN domain-containing protein [Sinorhizobium sp. 7-81]MDK1389410.1 NYN domain-containing protein [Sinorhizobium sp. 7-81]
MFDSREKIALFIDGPNLYAASRSLGFDVDYRKLLSAFQKRAYVLRAYYYTALVEELDFSSIRPLVDWLDYNGYIVVTKAAKEFTDSLGRRKIKGSMDIELTIDALEQSQAADHLVIFSGDGDFTRLVKALQRKGRKVSVVSTMATQPPMVADELRRQADHFIDLVTLRTEIDRRADARNAAPATEITEDVKVDPRSVAARAR